MTNRERVKGLDMFRQGDVLVIPATSDTHGKQIERDNGRVVLAYGEVTGHAHAIKSRECELFTTDTDDAFLRVLSEAGVDLEHEEHDTITIPQGDWIVRRQREYVPDALPSWVAD